MKTFEEFADKCRLQIKHDDKEGECPLAQDWCDSFCCPFWPLMQRINALEDIMYARTPED